MSTFAAAPRAAASASSAATSRSLEAFTLLRPASASASATTLEAGLDAGERDLGGVPRGGLHRARSGRAFSSSVSRGSFSAAEKPA